MFKKIIIATLLLVAFAAPTYAAVSLDPELFPKGSATITGESAKDEAEAMGLGDDAKKHNEADQFRRVFTQRIITVLLGMAGTIAVYFIIMNGFWLVASGGKEETITQHKKGLMWAILGLVLVILSYSIMRFIISIPFQADQRTSMVEDRGQGNG